LDFKFFELDFPEIVAKKVERMLNYLDLSNREETSSEGYVDVRRRTQCTIGS
jgi:hypothetical protein